MRYQVPGTSKRLLSGCNCECPYVLTCAHMLSRFGHVRFFATLWTVACQASRSMESSRQEYRSGLPFPTPGDLPNPGIKPTSPALQADSSPLSHQGSHMSVLITANMVHLRTDILMALRKPRDFSCTQ